MAGLTPPVGLSEDESDDGNHSNPVCLGVELTLLRASGVKDFVEIFTPSANNINVLPYL